MRIRKILPYLPSLLVGVVLGCLLLTLFSIVLHNHKPTDNADYSDYYANYASTIQKEDCYLCGNNPDSPITPYLGENNIGLINLNTFECTRFEVNRYGESKELIEKLVKFGTSHGQRGDSKTETTFGYSVYCNKGYLYADLAFNENSDLQLEKIQKFLCSDCLENVMEEYWSDERHWDVALIDFKNGKIKPFAESIAGTSLSDYYVSMQYIPEYDKMDITAFYCPVRYSELDYNPDLSVTDEVMQYCVSNNIEFSLNDEVREFLSGFEEIAGMSYDDESVIFRNEPFMGSKELTINNDGTYEIMDFDKLEDESTNE